ncbi:uncharacterized protein T551_02728 [Pneumocystis jirovecii RU7]|uniref:Uncharacterized protein n=1 Tax=Pneumocystis jirovecii (strain RU7) TaxID=1408657 RepID=A0A0W4ZIX4_PNEJ7|nr:uncharacterized protein T551_02728 [Pneumocystis jirovecii RU7]KTW28309.1 hypothetical protein T551_02728 [Pneumocystis jirovecii RU7]
MSLEVLKDVKIPKLPRRVKVYEMRDDNWHDCGTGYCTAVIENEMDGYFVVKSETNIEQVLLRSKIVCEDLYQIQQKTLIVWQELDGTDIALSFQEVDGCDEMWYFPGFINWCTRNFLNEVRKTLLATSEVLKPLDLESQIDDHVDEFFSDDVTKQNPSSPVILPAPELSNLVEIDAMILKANQTVFGKESLAKFVLNENYISQLISLLDVCEDLEILNDLHLLCSIMKNIILTNDAAIIEYILRDDIILGVVGILEYDSEFTTYKANYREYLSDTSKFKQVVDIKNTEIRNKIHQTFRLQYLKDVVLARVIDDLTFSILNTLIFFNQVDIVQHFQHNDEFLKELFGLFKDDSVELKRKFDAVIFINQICNVGKTLQSASRVSLYTTLVANSLFDVVRFALYSESSICIAGAEILMAIIEYDPSLVRSFILDQVNINDKSLLDVLIDLLHYESDLGIKVQIYETIRVLMDPTSISLDSISKFDISLQKSSVSDTDKFLQLFYDKSAKFLFEPILKLDLPTKEIDSISSTLLMYLCELLCFFVKVHSFRSKFFILSTNISCKIASLFTFPEKYIRLASLRYFRTCIGLNDEFYSRHFIKNNLFSPILSAYIEINDRDNLLSSACLEFFDVIRKENMKSIVNHLIETNGERIKNLNNIPIFDQLIKKYEQYHDKSHEIENSKTEDAKHTSVGRWSDARHVDIEEENYFNTSDDEDKDGIEKLDNFEEKKLVDYPDDDVEVYKKPDSNDYHIYDDNADFPLSSDKIAEKRHRDEDDDLGLLTCAKRNFAFDAKSTSPQSSPKKIAISIGNFKKATSSE